jgi:hypothetical protein
MLNLKADEVVLDCGCGYGYYLNRFKIPYLSAVMFPIFEEGALLDRHLGGQVSDELIIKAQKRCFLATVF